MIKGTDFTGISVEFFCHDGNGKYLVGKRSEKCRDEWGAWDPGGGGLKFGEGLEAGVRREVKEEYGAEPIDVEFLGYREVHREHNGKSTHWIAFDFRVQVKPEEVVNAEPEKMDEIRWVDPHNIPQPHHSQFPLFLEKYKEKLI